MRGAERNKKQGEDTASAASQAMLPGGSWGRGACYTEKLSLKDSAQEEDVSGGCCFGSVGEQGHKSALASGTKTVEMAC